jgi:hypothetical protein
MTKDFTTVFEGTSGFFAVHIWFDEEKGHFWEPYEWGRYTTREEAKAQARQWAEDMGLECHA